MAATTQANIDTLQAQIEQDSTLTNAQKAQAQGLLFSLAHKLFGGNAASTSNIGHSGRNDGHTG